jgi:hypothetical protein
MNLIPVCYGSMRGSFFPKDDSLPGAVITVIAPGALSGVHSRPAPAPLGALGRSLLAESDETLQTWRRRFPKDGGRHAGLIGPYRFDGHQRSIAVLDALEFLLAEQFEYERAAPVENLASNVDGDCVDEKVKGRISGIRRGIRIKHVCLLEADGHPSSTGSRRLAPVVAAAEPARGYVHDAAGNGPW